MRSLHTLIWCFAIPGQPSNMEHHLARFHTVLPEDGHIVAAVRLSHTLYAATCVQLVQQWCSRHTIHMAQYFKNSKYHKCTN